MSEPVNFEKHIKNAYSWLDEIARKAGTPDRTDWAYNALKAVLHTIRDRTTVEEVFHLSAQLPLFIRGVYFEGYKPADKPDKMNLDEFLQRIRERMGPGNNVEPEQAFHAVLEVLGKHVSIGELMDIKTSMPKDIQRLWDSSLSRSKAGVH